MTYVINDMPNQVDPALVEKAHRTETATVGHVRHMGFVDRSLQQNDSYRIRTCAGEAHLPSKQAQ